MCFWYLEIWGVSCRATLGETDIHFDGVQWTWFQMDWKCCYGVKIWKDWVCDWEKKDMRRFSYNWLRSQHYIEWFRVSLLELMFPNILELELKPSCTRAHAGKMRVLEVLCDTFFFLHFFFFFLNHLLLIKRKYFLKFINVARTQHCIVLDKWGFYEVCQYESAAWQKVKCMILNMYV